MDQPTAVIIIGHGSPVSEANNTLLEVIKSIKSKGGYNIVQPAFLQFEHPNFYEAINILVKQGIKDIIVQPYFLYMGAHVKKDLPLEIETAKKKYPDIKITAAPHLGFHEKLAEVAVERIEEAIKRGGVRENKPSNPICQHPIEAESFRIIGKQLDESRFSSTELQIVKRIIHTTADFEYSDLVRFSSDAIEIGCNAISNGRDIITDVKMIEVGISKERLAMFGGKVMCFISDDDVKEKAVEKNITRAAAAIHKAKDFINGNIVAIGNAPTALIELIKTIKHGKTKPSLVIGVPVGFVDAEESKEKLMKLEVPYISIKGEKGGSTVAVAIVNALLIIAEEREKYACF